MFKRIAALTAVLSALLLVGGCDALFSDGQTLSTDIAFDFGSQGDILQGIGGKNPGEACGNDAECRPGLACIAEVCTITGDGAENSFCTITKDCAEGLVCAFDTENLKQPKMCYPEGDGEDWDICTTNRDCKRGYFCEIISFTGTCQPEGESDVGGACDSTRDCGAGLYCGKDGACGILGAQLPLFTGETCQPTSQDEGLPRPYFEVPRNGQPLKDFYRLPFPNDIRFVDDKLSLNGHPTPGPGAVGFDIAARLMSAMEEDLTGYGTNPVVFFRFSKSPDLGTINPKNSPNVFLVDITNSAQGGYGKSLPLNWVANTGRGLYICQNYIAVYVPWARPLSGNRTYAVLLTDTIKAEPEEEGGDPREFEQDGDFKTMLSPTFPEDADLKAAWDQYSPLREFLSSGSASMLGVSKGSLISAAVFSTYSPVQHMAKFKEEMDTYDLPEVPQMVLCEDKNTVSPCDDGLMDPETHKRGCFDTDPNFYEFQGVVRVPTFQNGQKPYIEPEDGGGVEWDAIGRPVVKGFEEVCFALTIPKGTAPAEGWPVVLYGHGTGGNYRSHITTGVAGNIAKFNAYNTDTEAYDRPLQVATFGWDQILHGPRIGPAPVDPDAMVFNFRNPRAALGNFYQQAAETMILARLLTNWNDVTLPATTPGAPINSAKVIFMGHSQGGISGPLAIPFVDAVNEMIISGTGGGLVESLLRKTSPVDVRDGVIVALQDENVGRTHPVLAMLQNYYDPVDPINYASLLFYEPYLGHRVRTLHTLGLLDTHTPPTTIKDLAAAMRVQLAPSPSLPDDKFETFGGVQVVDLPRKVNGGITVEYLPGDYDGHFVIFRHVDAIREYVNFIGTAILDEVPYLVD